MKNLSKGQKRRQHVERRASRKPARERAKKIAKKIHKKKRHSIPPIDFMRPPTHHLSPLNRPWRDMFSTKYVIP